MISALNYAKNICFKKLLLLTEGSGKNRKVHLASMHAIGKIKIGGRILLFLSMDQCDFLYFFIRFFPLQIARCKNFFVCEWMAWWSGTEQERKVKQKAEMEKKMFWQQKKIYTKLLLTLQDSCCCCCCVGGDDGQRRAHQPKPAASMGHKLTTTRKRKKKRVTQMWKVIGCFGVGRLFPVVGTYLFVLPKSWEEWRNKQYNT